KIIRALEICLTARRPVSELHEAPTRPLEGFDPILIGIEPPRAELYQVLNQRCVTMFEQGLLEEVRHILSLGYKRTAKPFESLGYKQSLLLIDGEYTFDQTLEEMQIETRRYAKRQWTWFKKDSRVSWIPGFGHSPEVKQNTLETLVSRNAGLLNFLR